MSDSAWLALVAGMGIFGTLIGALLQSRWADRRMEKQADRVDARSEADRKRAEQQKLISIVEDHLRIIETLAAKWQIWAAKRFHPPSDPVAALQARELGEKEAQAIAEGGANVFVGLIGANVACDFLFDTATWKEPLAAVEDKIDELGLAAISGDREKFAKTLVEYATNMFTIRAELNRLSTETFKIQV